LIHCLGNFQDIALDQGPICLRQCEDSDSSSSHLLLESHARVTGHEKVEAIGLRQIQQLTILFLVPAAVISRKYLVPRQVLAKGPGDIVVEKDAHQWLAATPGRKTDLMRRRTSRLAPGYHSNTCSGRRAVFIALKHGQQPQPRSNQHRLAPENLGITGNEALKLLFDRCHILIFVLAGWFVQTAPAGEIVQKPLDEFVIYNLPIAFKSGNTTVLFPSAISALYAKSVAVQEQANADFLISFTPGNYYFTIRALRSEAKDHLTVIYNRKAYVLRLSASEKPFYAVTFFQDARPRGPQRPVVPERLLSLIDKAKAYPLFQKDYPDALAGVLHAAPNTVNDNFKLWIRDQKRACLWSRPKGQNASCRGSSSRNNTFWLACTRSPHRSVSRHTALCGPWSLVWRTCPWLGTVTNLCHKSQGFLPAHAGTTE
jgi:hypothetical protein